MSELRSMSFGTEAYHYAVMPDGEVIKNNDAFKEGNNAEPFPWHQFSEGEAQ